MIRVEPLEMLCFSNSHIIKSNDDIFIPVSTGANTNKIAELSENLIEAHTKLIIKSLEIKNQANDKIVETITEEGELRKNDPFVEQRSVTCAKVESKNACR